MRSPNFFLAGVAKAGTSTLHALLRGHGQIFMPEKKELHFYCGCPERLKTVPDEAAYIGEFSGASSDAVIIGEASPCYLYYEGVMERIAERWDASRILVSLRDPVDRFWSHYLMNSWYHDDYPDPHRVIDDWQSGVVRCHAVDDLVGSGMYAFQLSRLYEAFDPGRVMITTLEALSATPDIVWKEVLEFLNLDQTTPRASAREKAYAVPRNPLSAAILRQRRLRTWAARHVPAVARRFVKYRILGDAARKPEPSKDLVVRLREIYAADVKRTQELVGRSLPWPHFASSTER